MINETVFCVTSAYSLGCTFLDWSILYLSGTSQVWNVAKKIWIDLVDNPLSSQQTLNAHAHQRNMCSGEAGCTELLDGVRPESDVFSFYATDLPLDLCCQKTGVDVKNLQANIKKVLEYQHRDYANMLRIIAEDRKIPMIYVALDSTVRGYLWQERTLDRKRFSQQSAQSVGEMEQEFDQVFFNDSIDRWRNLGLDSVWDNRERLALNLRPFDPLYYEDFTMPYRHYWLHCKDLWFDTERNLRKVLQWLDLPINEERVPHWRHIARQWQCIQNNSMKFARELDQIVLATVRGHYHEIPELTLKQEAIIQHCLIYQYNLNLRTWQLERFPKNTLDLHELLVPNNHVITD